MFELAPLERRVLPEPEIPDLTSLLRRHQVTCERVEQRSVWTRLGTALWVLGFLMIGYVAGGVVFGGDWWSTGALVVSGVVAIALLVALRDDFLRKDVRSGATLIERWLRRQLAILAVLGIAVVGPGLALVYGTELRQIVRLEADGLQVDGPTAMVSPVLVGRTLQLVFIVVLALLPASMYFQFDRERLSTLRRRWTWQIFRLDPAMNTIADVQSKYGSHVDEAYGGAGGGRLVRGGQTPLVVTTVLLVIGWLLVLMNADIELMESNPTEQGPRIGLNELFDPDPSVVTYAFLGAYFFVLLLMLRSYVRGDLHPKQYNAASVRIVVVSIVAWLLQSAAPTVDNQDLVLLVAFFAGFLPDTTVRRLSEIASQASHMPFSSELDQERPLSDIAGMDLYERTRLHNEGITNVQALATHDVIDLMLKTRIPVARLLDWLDRAILLLHIAPLAGPDDDDEAKYLARLEQSGVSGIIDLLELLPISSDETVAKANAPFLAPSDQEESADRLLLAIRAVEHREWVAYLRNWRCSPLASTDPATWWYIDGTGERRRYPSTEVASQTQALPPVLTSTLS